MTLQMKYEERLKELREKYLGDLQCSEDIKTLNKAYEEGRKFGSDTRALNGNREDAQFSA
ncbi:hypothetical protein [Thalassospira lucentensis]|uniref:hypothetical protein n=1 Tax=Thalassospira lucentensis TaxID=168935 RepID=UPI0003B74D91|nr:hypothetical protein [Thalassospira lucentensis]RCK28666.1 hypothetical protein TH1_09345 [Thalassospira lucentensis MCCC 1A00383 = DSM 14000]